MTSNPEDFRILGIISLFNLIGPAGYPTGWILVIAGS